jgi:hypothetical protein
VARAYEASAPLKVRVAAGPSQGEPVFSNPYRAGERREAISSAVAERWTTRPGQAAPASGAAQMQPAHLAAQPTPNDVVRAGHESARRAYFPTTPPAAAAEEPLGLFQDMRPNVQALFTRG